MKKIGFWTALALVVGNIIGVGIFTTTGFVTTYVQRPDLILLVWFTGALYALSGAVVYGFLAQQMPQRGGDYVYLKQYFPPYLSFLFGWSGLFITYTGSIAALAIGAATYFADLLPFLLLETNLLGIDGLKLVAIAFVLLFTLINILGIRSGGKTQFVLTLFIFLLLTGFVIFGFIYGNTANNFQFTSGSIGYGGPFISALAAVLFTYMGWTTVVYIADEIKNPRRNIPLALLSGVGLIAVLYMGINYLFIRILPVSELAGQLNVATLVAQKIWGSESARFIAGMILIAILSSLNSTILSGPRIYQVMATDGFLWKKLGSEHPKFKTPYWALWIQGGWSIFLLVSGTFEQLLSMVVAVILLFSILTTVVAIKSLIKKTFGSKWLYWLSSVFYLLLCSIILVNILYTQFYTTIAGILILSPSIPVYIYQRK